MSRRRGKTSLDLNTLDRQWDLVIGKDYQFKYYTSMTFGRICCQSWTNFVKWIWIFSLTAILFMYSSFTPQLLSICHMNLIYVGHALEAEGKGKLWRGKLHRPFLVALFVSDTHTQCHTANSYKSLCFKSSFFSSVPRVPVVDSVRKGK